MKAIEFLPKGYGEIYSINIQKDKKISLIINLFAVIITVLLILPMHLYLPVFTLFDYSKGITAYFTRIAVLMVSVVIYMILHELVHGIAMKICGTKKVKYGFTGLYAFAGSEDYYDKKSYIFIALSPIVFWGIIIAVVNLFVSREWFWVVYFIQVINLSGAAGDLFISLKFLRMPGDILVRDSGVSMTVFSKEEKPV